MNEERNETGSASVINIKFETPVGAHPVSNKSQNKSSGFRRKLFSPSDKAKSSSDPLKDINSFLQNSPQTPTQTKSAQDLLDHTPKRLTERQQTALLLQLTAEDCKKGLDESPLTECDNKLKRLLRRNERGETQLHIATIKGDAQLVKQLINKGHPVDATDFAGWTALHEACNHGWLEIANILLKNGANVNASGDENITPLHDAAQYGSYKLVQLLLKNGADINIQTFKGKTAIDVSSKSSITTLLRKRGKENCKPSLAGDLTPPVTPVMKRASPHRGSPRLTLKLSVAASPVSSSDESHVKKMDFSKEGKEDKEQPSTSDQDKEDKDRNVVSSSKDGESEEDGNLKRTHSEDEEDEENKKKKTKKEEKTPARSNINRAPKGNKSAPTKASASPMPKSPVSSPAAENEEGDKRESFLKVPPLKIVLAPLRDRETEGETRGTTGKNGGSRHPYILQKPAGSPEAQGSPTSESKKPESPKPESSDVPVTSSQSSTSATETSTSDCTIPVDVHPRKRKLRPRETSPPPTSTDDHTPQPSIANSYQSFFSLRKQIESRHRNLYPVQPKPPGGFKDYLMNRCSYVLAGNAASRLSVPRISPPNTLQIPLKDLYNEQEKERYKLRLQHLIEKEKLVLAVEQEILRVHGQYARALVNQPLPLSVCTILKDQEIYNALTPEQEDKDRTARSRYNGRLFLSWLQDVDDKWDKIKEDMVLRHVNESESLHAVQKMMWEWKLKEIGCCEPKSTPTIPEEHVPQVHVTKDFDLLPA